MSVFEDSSVLKNISPVGTAASEASRPRINVGASAGNGGATTNSGSFSASAVRAGARNQQQKKAEYVTRNQLKQVAFRLDQKARTLTVLTVVVAVGAVAAIALGALAFLRSGADQATDTKADATIAQLQSQVSMLELEMQSFTAKLEELQSSQQPDESQPVTGGSTTGGADDSGVHITTNGDPSGGDPSAGNETGSGDPSAGGETGPSNTGLETGGGSTTEDTEIDTTFETVEGDGTSIYALVNQDFEGTTTYQWQKSANRETWTDVNTSAAKTAKLKVSIDDYLRNNAYRCCITNVDSKGVTTVYFTEIVDYNAYEIWKLIS